MNEEELGVQKSKSDKIAAAKERIKAAEGRSPMEKMKAEAALAALEAEHVTGLKPVVLGRGRGKGGRWSSGRGRGRSSGRGTGGRSKRT